MFDQVSWLITGIALTGTLLNLHKMRECFLFWGVTNGYWVFYDIYKTAYAQAGLNAIYFLLAIWGFLKWREKC